MSVLVHIATRGRGFEWLRDWIEKAQSPHTQFLISLDDDDLQPIHDWVKDRCMIARGESRGKIAAMNRGISVVDNWDLLIVGSDDMRPLVDGYDMILLKHLENIYPDTDGCLWTPTEDARGHRRKGGMIRANGDAAYMRGWICMLPIMGRKYYERFKYVYHPSYRSFWCDNEQTDVARKLGKIRYVDQQIFKHLHPAWDTEGKDDEVYQIANKDWERDMKNYNNRKAHGYPA